jgi:hypothetical protein
MSVSTKAKHSAFDRVLGSIDGEAQFPAQVFRGHWSAFLFFDSDFLIAPDFSERVAELLNAEQAEVCCLLNFDETDTMTFASAAIRFITAETSPQDYNAMLREGGRNAWLFGVDRYGCASDRGGWSIYCERQNDIAVIALPQTGDTEKYAACLKHIQAKPIADQLRAGAEGLFQFEQMVEPWRRALSMHYGGTSAPL